MDGRPKRQSAADKDYRERKRLRKEAEPSDKAAKVQGNDTELAVCKQLYKDVKDAKDPDDESRLLSSFFTQLPSKRQYPDYYDIIKQPIALSTIKSKIDHHEYSTLADMKADIELMVSNAKKYNMKDSLVYQDAVKIQKLAKAWKPEGATKSSADAKERGASTSASPSSEKKGKNVLKLPIGAFGANAKTSNAQQQQQQQQQQQPQQPPQESKVKAIRLKAVDKQNKKGLQEVMDAICNRETKKAIELLESDDTIDPNGLVEVEMFNDKFKWGPLHAAAYYGDIKTIHVLMERGADIELNDTWYSGTPLSWAAFGEQDKVARVLVEQYNADRNARNREGQVPFDLVPDPDDPRWVGVLKGPFQPGTSQHERRLVTSVSLPANRKAEEIGDSSDFPRKKRGRPPKAEKESLEAMNRPVSEVDLSEFDQVAYMKELFHAIRVHTDNTGRLYSEIFEDLPDREEYPDYYKTIKRPLSLSVIEDNMINRRYPTLGDWFNDMKTMFDNAMEYNEPGSRVYKDAKLLLRLLHRLKDRNLAREGVPESQESEVMRLSLADRPYDTDDKRKPKRPPPRPKSHTSDTTVDITSTSATVPQPAVRQNIGITPAPGAPGLPLNAHPMILQGLVQPQAFPGPDYTVPENLLNETIVHSVQRNASAQQLATASPAFFEEFNVDLRELRPLTGIRLESIDNSVKVVLGGKFIGHSLSLGSNVETIKIMPMLKDVLRSESRRLSVVILQNNSKLNMVEGDLESEENPPCWVTGPLMKGLNTIKITITANVTKADMPMVPMPDYKTQVYFIFISRF